MKMISTKLILRKFSLLATKMVAYSQLYGSSYLFILNSHSYPNIAQRENSVVIMFGELDGQRFWQKSLANERSAKILLIVITSYFGWFQLGKPLMIHKSLIVCQINKTFSSAKLSRYMVHQINEIILVKITIMQQLNYCVCYIIWQLVKPCK